MSEALVGLCHVVFHVSDPDRTARFWEDTLGFAVVYKLGPDAVFLRAPGSDEPFDIGLMGAGHEAIGAGVQVRRGVYHAAWSVPSLDVLQELSRKCSKGDKLIGTSDHGTHVSVYVVDPDGNELEFCWKRPREQWPPEGLTSLPANVLEGEPL